MTPIEAGHLLTTIAIIDNRKAGEPEDAIRVAKMWARSLSIHDITYTEAEWAVSQHFATSTEWLQPAHITKLVLANRTRNARVIEGSTPTLDMASVNVPHHLDPDDVPGYLAWLASTRHQVARGIQPPTHQLKNPAPRPPGLRALPMKEIPDA